MLDPDLKGLLSQPNAPFREIHVVLWVKKFLTQHKVPFFSDPAGNIVVGVSSVKEYVAILNKPERDPVRVFIAHMDHPGFHVTRVSSDSELEIKWFGGGTPRVYLESAPVWLADNSGWVGEGTLDRPKLVDRGLDTAIVRIKSGMKFRSTKELFGGFKFKDTVWEDNRILYTKAADDLIGVFTIVDLARTLWASKRKKNIPFIGLLTRAEEVGFVGAIFHFGYPWLRKAKRKVVCISLETSRTYPGADVGKGPVVRMGDRATIFDAATVSILTDIAKKKLSQYQKRVMEGGTCEATVAVANGFTAVGIAIPLGNYHNQSFQGGPDSLGPLGPGPEFVHTEDIKGMQILCKALLEKGLPWETPWEEKQIEFEKLKKNYSPLVKRFMPIS